MKVATTSKFANGVLFVTLGVLLFAVRHLDHFAELLVFLVVGGAFLSTYFYYRLYGLLIPGALLLGTGFGLWLQHRAESLPLDFPLLVGVGAGFLLIYGIGYFYERRRDWWPLLPGFILFFLEFVLRFPGMLIRYKDYWPFILILAGFILIFSSYCSSTRVKKDD